MTDDVFTVCDYLGSGIQHPYDAWMACYERSGNISWDMVHMFLHYIENNITNSHNKAKRPSIVERPGCIYIWLWMTYISSTRLASVCKSAISYITSWQNINAFLVSSNIRGICFPKHRLKYASVRSIITFIKWLLLSLAFELNNILMMEAAIED